MASGWGIVCCMTRNWVAQARKSTYDTDINGKGPSINSAVKVVDYPELKSSLMNLLGQYRSVLAFPGEPLGVRLKPDTKHIYSYVPSYRLPHSQRLLLTMWLTTCSSKVWLRSPVHCETLHFSSFRKKTEHSDRSLISVVSVL